jgi:hypothetical protein
MGVKHVSDVVVDHDIVEQKFWPSFADADKFTTPKLTPVTVTDVPPVVGALRGARFVSTGESNVKRTDDVPTTELTVTDACAKPAPPSELQMTVVSVTQFVCWHGHRPKSTDCPMLAVPKFFPKSVNDIPRETAAFVYELMRPVITAESNVKPAVTVWARPFTVVSTLLACPVPADFVTRSEVALTYATWPAAVAPTSTVADGSTVPKLMPFTVVIRPRMVGPFGVFMYVTTGASYVKPMYCVPMLPAMGTSRFCARPVPGGTLQSILVPVNLATVVHMRPPTRIDAVPSYWPKFMPNRVIDEPPVEGPFGRLARVMTGESYVNAATNDPTTSVMVAATVVAAPRPSATRHSARDADFHDVHMQLVAPTRTSIASAPKLVPDSVMITFALAG